MSYERSELRGYPLELLQVAAAEVRESATSRCGQPQPDVTVVRRIRDPPEQARGARPVDQLDRAVVFLDQIRSHIFDRWTSWIGVPSDGEHQLMLSRSDPLGFGRFLAPPQESAQSRPQLEEPPVVGIPDIAHVGIS